MSWHSGTFSATTAGELLAVLDVDLVANSNWSIYDAAAGTNHKVYRNYDAAENVDYYVSVDDDYTGYAVIELWEGWDSGSHIGTGTGLTTIATYAMRINRPVGGWQMSVKDHRFIFINSNYVGTYIGQLKRYDTTKNMPCYLGELTGVSKYNALGYGTSNGSNTGLACLFDEGGTTRLIELHANTNSEKYVKTIAGTMLVWEAPVYNTNSFLIMGLLEGVAQMYSANNGLTSGQTVDNNGVDWVAIGGDSSTKYWSFIEKA